MEELVIKYKQLIKSELSDAFTKGDIALDIIRQHKVNRKNSKTNIIEEFLRETSESRVSFNQYAWVSKVFPKESRQLYGGLTWSHYRAAANCKNSAEVLKEAYLNKYSVSELIEKIKLGKTDLVNSAKVTEEYCVCGNLIEDVFILSVQSKLLADGKFFKNSFCSVDCLISYAKGLKKPEEENHAETMSADRINH